MKVCLMGLAAGVLVAIGIAGCGSDESTGTDGGLVKKRHKPDAQCGRYYDHMPAADSEVGFDRCTDAIESYCEYGAVSRAQLKACEKNVTWGQFKSLNTNAALYARYEIDKCLPDAGPFCRKRTYDEGY